MINIFNVDPYLHSNLVTFSQTYSVPVDVKNLILTVTIGDLELAASASGVCTIQLSADGGQTFDDVVISPFNWVNALNRDGVVNRRMEFHASVLDKYKGGTGKGFVTLDGSLIVGFRMDYV